MSTSSPDSRELIHRVPLSSVPHIADSAWIADNATVIGNVFLGRRSSVWYGAVVRADLNKIEIGDRSNIQDLCVIHVADDFPCIVGCDSVVGHNATLHGCTIGDGVLIGIGAILLNGCVVGDGSIIGAGALVPEGKIIPPCSLVLGSPGRVTRPVSEAELAETIGFAQKYVRLIALHQRQP